MRETGRANRVAVLSRDKTDVSRGGGSKWEGRGWVSNILKEWPWKSVTPGRKGGKFRDEQYIRIWHASSERINSVNSTLLYRLHTHHCKSFTGGTGVESRRIWSADANANCPSPEIPLRIHAILSEILIFFWEGAQPLHRKKWIFRLKWRVLVNSERCFWGRDNLH